MEYKQSTNWDSNVSRIFIRILFFISVLIFICFIIGSIKITDFAYNSQTWQDETIKKGVTCIKMGKTSIFFSKIFVIIFWLIILLFFIWCIKNFNILKDRVMTL